MDWILPSSDLTIIKSVWEHKETNDLKLPTYTDLCLVPQDIWDKMPARFFRKPGVSRKTAANLKAKGAHTKY